MAFTDLFTGANPVASVAEGAVKGFGDTVANIISKFKADPTKVVEVSAELEKASLDLQKSVIVAVNETMQAEAKSEHWAQWLWRPFVGFTFSATIINNYILYSYFAKYGMTQIQIPENMWLAMLAVLGVSAYVRGRDK